MSRWDPHARERLDQAALELFGERGYDHTTVQDIAARAGLTERTFFRYFTDKREVLFWGSERLEDLLVEQVTNAPREVAPLAAVARALEATSAFFEDRRKLVAVRHGLIIAHAELQERELIKLASLATALGAALRHRGIAAAAAALAAEMGIAIFKTAFELWITDPKKRDLAHHVRESLAELEAVAAGKPSGAATSRPAKKTRRPSGLKSPSASRRQRAISTPEN